MRPVSWADHAGADDGGGDGGRLRHRLAPVHGRVGVARCGGRELGQRRGVAAGAVSAPSSPPLAGDPALEEGRQRQQRGDLLARGALGSERRPIEARGERGAPAGLAVGDVARHLALVAGPRAAAGGAGDDRLDARQRSPETSSSYSSDRRRRARKSVDSTDGRLMPERSPISR
jgi:hypothetical protein